MATIAWCTAVGRELHAPSQFDRSRTQQTPPAMDNKTRRCDHLMHHSENCTDSRGLQLQITHAHKGLVRGPSPLEVKPKVVRAAIARGLGTAAPAAGVQEGAYRSVSLSTVDRTSACSWAASGRLCRRLSVAVAFTGLGVHARLEPVASSHCTSASHVLHLRKQSFYKYLSS